MTCQGSPPVHPVFFRDLSSQEEPGALITTKDGQRLTRAQVDSLEPALTSWTRPWVLAHTGLLTLAFLGACLNPPLDHEHQQTLLSPSGRDTRSVPSAGSQSAISRHGEAPEPRRDKSHIEELTRAPSAKGKARRVER